VLSRVLNPAVIVGVVLLAMAVMIVAPLLTNRATEGSRSELVNEVEPFALSLGRADRDLFALSAAARGYVITRDPDELERYTAARAAIDAEHAALGGYAEPAGYASETARLTQLAEDYVAVADAIIGATARGSEEDIPSLVAGPGRDALAAYRGPADDLDSMVRGNIERLRRSVERAHARGQLVVGIAGGFGVLSAFSLVWLAFASSRLLRRTESQRAHIDAVIRDVPGVVWEAWGEPDAANQRIDFVSDRIEPMTGYSREEWLNTPNFWLTIVHPDDRERAAEEAVRIFQSGSGGVSEFRWVARDGSIVWVAAYSSVMLDNAGHPVGMRGVTVDITERKRAGEALAFSAEVTRALLPSLNVERSLAALADLCVPHLADWCAVHIVDDDRQVRMASLAHADPEKVAFARELGERYPSDLHAQTGVYQVLRTGIAEMADIPDAALMASARDPDHLRILRELGLRSYISVAMQARGRVLGAFTLVSSDSGRRYGADDLVIAEDIAARAAVAVDNARLYQEAQIERARFLTIVDTAAYGVVALAEDCRITYVNPAAERMFGATLAELENRSFDEMTPVVPAAEQDTGVFVSALHQSTAYEGRVMMRRERGETFPAEVNLSFISARARGGGAVVAFRDITAQLREQESKDDFLAFASHELRSPLTSVVGLSKWLAKQTTTHPEMFNADGRDAIETLEHEAERMASIVEVFLDLSRIEVGRIQCYPEPVDIAGLVLEQSDALRRRYPHVVITVHGVEDPWVIVTDPACVEQALTNLLDNAAKYGGDAPAVTLTLERDGKGAAIRVRDRGPGISPEDQAHIFERRYRGGGSAKGKRGLGVGLFITRAMVEALGGTLSLTGAPGEGAEFVITLPATAPRA